MSTAMFVEHPLWSRLASMHLHFLWQGLFIACLYWGVVKLFNMTSARLRYILGMGGLAAMMLSTLATFWLVEVPERGSEMAVASESLQSVAPSEDMEAPLPGSDLQESLSSEAPSP